MVDPLHNVPKMKRGRDRVLRYGRGKKWPAWALLAIPFAMVMVVLYPLVKRKVNWRACWLTVLVFEVMMLPVEHYAVILGFWVYNTNRLLGPEIWGIPIEEPLIYYFLPPMMVVMAFELVTGLLNKTIKFNWESQLARWVARTS